MDHIENLNALRDENERLRQRVAELETEIANYKGSYEYAKLELATALKTTSDKTLEYYASSAAKRIAELYGMSRRTLYMLHLANKALAAITNGSIATEIAAVQSEVNRVISDPTYSGIEVHQKLRDEAKSVNEAMKSNLQSIVNELESTMRCNCDLDNWQPEPDTGHSCVCRIHNAAKERVKNLRKGVKES